MYTLLELERTHGCPMIVRDTIQDIDYLIVSVSPESFAMYEAKRIAEGSRSVPIGTPSILLYGGYIKWLYLGRPDTGGGISPEEQRRIKEEERKRVNARLTRELKRDKEIHKASEPPKKKSTSNNGEAKVIPLHAKKDKK
jgi:hypothetical protein